MTFHYLLDYGLLDKMMYSILQSPTDLSYQYLESMEQTYDTTFDWEKYDDFFKIHHTFWMLTWVNIILWI